MKNAAFCLLLSFLLASCEITKETNSLSAPCNYQLENAFALNAPCDYSLWSNSSFEDVLTGELAGDRMQFEFGFGPLSFSGIGDVVIGENPVNVETNRIDQGWYLLHQEIYNGVLYTYIYLESDDKSKRCKFFTKDVVDLNEIREMMSSFKFE